MAVDDLDASMAAVEAAGGRILAPPFYIEGVGRLAYFEDTEGNFVGVMQYDQPESGSPVPTVELRRRLSGPLGRDHLPGRLRGCIATTTPGASSPSATAA